MVMCIIISSCQEEKIEISPANIPAYQNNDVNIALEELTKLFLEAITSESFRGKLKNEALVEYYDDYLYKQSLLKSGKTENQIENLLRQYSENFDFDRIQKLVEKVPNYEVSVPVNADIWDEENYQPLIAFIPSDFNEKIHKRIKAFDNSGKIVWLSVEEDPVLPVILIRPKEDIDLTNYLPDNGTSLKSGRINGANEFVKQIGTDNIGKVEPWIKGPRCEIKVITISSKTGGIMSTLI